MTNKYICLRDEWTIRGTAKSWIMFNFRKGLCEDRFDLSRDAYAVLRLATGKYSIGEIERKTGVDPIPYLDYLVEIGAAEILEAPRALPRSLPAPYPGQYFLGRIMFHITGRCNLECVHCYLTARDWGEELTTDEVTGVIRQSEEMNVASVSITGGEPFVRQDLLDILRALDERQIKIEGIFTNATIISDDFLDEAERIQEFPYFVSINGAFTESHDGFIGVEGSFDLTLRAIRRLHERGIKVFANTSLSVFVDDDRQIERFYRLIRDLKIYRWRVSTPFLEGSWKDNALKFGLSIERELQIFLALLRLWEADGRPFDLELGHVFRYVGGEFEDPTYRESDYVCDYFRERIVILPNGDVGACPLLITEPYLIGNIRCQSLREIWERDRMRYFKDLRIRDIIEEGCRTCGKLSSCGIGCRANSVLRGGEYEDIDPEICDIQLSPLYDQFQNFLKESGMTMGRNR